MTDLKDLDAFQAVDRSPDEAMPKSRLIIVLPSTRFVWVEIPWQLASGAVE
jgi:hypothetical protein